MLADRFVKDPHEVVKAGDVVKVKVLEIDLKRNRIGLSMRLNERPAPPSGERRGDVRPAPQRAVASPPQPAAGGALAEAFARAKRK